MMILAAQTALEGLKTNEIVFPRLGIDLEVNSVAFTLFGISVTWYGILITFGMILAMLYGFSRMRKFGIDADRAIDAVIGGVIGAIIGARTYYITFHWSEYAGNWKAIFNIRNGGLAIYGAIIGALLVGGIICKLRKVRLLPMLDVTALGFLIGQCIGRWGNFTNHEAFGANTDGLFGMSSGKIQAWITQHYTDGSVVADRPVHPCFFYESMWCLAGFILLHIVSQKWRKFDGQIFLMYIVWYGLGRFFIEGLRTDSLYLGTLRISQVVALLSVVVGTVLFFVCLSRVTRMGTDYRLYCDTQESKALLEEADRRIAEEETRRSQKKSAAAEDSDAESTHVLLSEEDAEALQQETESAAETEDTEVEHTNTADDSAEEAAEDQSE